MCVSIYLYKLYIYIYIYIYSAMFQKIKGAVKFFSTINLNYKILNTFRGLCTLGNMYQHINYAAKIN